MTSFGPEQIAAMNANINNPNWSPSPQPIWNDPSAGFSRMGEAFGQLPMNPMFMGSLAMLTNEGRMTPGIMQSMLGMQALHDRRSLSKEEQKRYEREMRNMEKSQAALQKILTRNMGGAQPRPTGAPTIPRGEAAGPFSAALPSALQGPLYGFGPSQAAQYQSSLFPPTQAPAAAPAGPMAGASPMGPRGGATPMSLPLGGIQQPPPFEGAPAGSGAPAGAVPLSSRDDQQAAVALALMGGSRQDRAQGINILANMLSRQPEERRIIEDAYGRKRYVDTGELVFDLPPQAQGPARPFRSVKSPTEPMVFIQTAWDAMVARQGLDPEKLTQQQADVFADAAARRYKDTWKTIQAGQDFYAVPGADLGGQFSGGWDEDFMNALALRAAENSAAREAGVLPGTYLPPSAARSAGGGIPGFKGKKTPTENEMKTRVAATPIFNALVGMHNAEVGGFDPSSYLVELQQQDSDAGPTIWNRLAQHAASTEQKDYALFTRNLASETARLKSGAVIKNQELWDEMAKNMPIATDGPQQRARKMFYRTSAALSIFNNLLDAHTTSDPNYSTDVERFGGIENIRAMRNHVQSKVMPEVMRFARSNGVEDLDAAGIYAPLLEPNTAPDALHEQVFDIMRNAPEGTTAEDYERLLGVGR